MGFLASELRDEKHRISDKSQIIIHEYEANVPKFKKNIFTY